MPGLNLSKLQIISLLCLLLVFTACSPVEESPDWAYADLRLLDPADDAVIPGHDLVALYIRTVEDKLQFRLDLLDLAPIPEMDLYLALDTVPGGSSWLPLEASAAIEWDVLLTIPAAGSIQIDTPGAMPGSLVPLPEVGLRVLRNPAKDSLEINLNQSAIWNGNRSPRSAPLFKLQVFTTAPGSLQTSDLTQPVGSQDQPPAQAPLLLAYWNTLPAYTPAQSLRRWDGAHTGPQGGRHGLYNLLRTARNAGIPLLLLDLNSSLPLAALDYLENLSLVNELAQTDEVILPFKVPGFLLQESSSGVDRILDGIRQEAASFALPSDRLLFVDGASPADWDVDGWLASQKPGVIFFPRLAIEPGAGILPDQVTQVSRWQDWRVIPVPRGTPGFQQVSQEGLSLDARRLLVQTAIQNQEQNAPAIVILGGSLPASEWGNPDNSREAFAYIRAHPWIKPVASKDLFTLRALPADDSLLENYSPIHKPVGDCCPTGTGRSPKGCAGQ